MSEKEKLKATREKVIEALDGEPLELKAGCKIKIVDEHFSALKMGSYSDNLFTIITECRPDKNIYLVLTFGGVDHFNWRDIDKFCEIIGRELRLADVLLAMRKSLDEQTYADEAIRLCNIFCAGHGHYTGALSQELWNLTKSLEEQDEPTINFLYDLLTKSKV